MLKLIPKFNAYYTKGIEKGFLWKYKFHPEIRHITSLLRRLKMQPECFEPFSHSNTNIHSFTMIQPISYYTIQFKNTPNYAWYFIITILMKSYYEDLGWKWNGTLSWT